MTKRVRTGAALVFFAVVLYVLAALPESVKERMQESEWGLFVASVCLFSGLIIFAGGDDG